MLLIASMLVITGCSTQKNTSMSRWWQSFNTKYNVYYNATLAYVDASVEKENGNKDNYTELIPLYTVSNKDSRDLGKGNYDKAIEKCEKAIQLHSIKKRPEWTKDRKKTERDLEWLNRKEYNPYLWKVWLLMGRSQFYSGQFEEAASTFAYMGRLYETQPAIYGKARAWLAKCYIEQGWNYDAEDIIRKMERDSIHWRAQKEWDYTYADYYIHTGEFQKAVPYLRKVISHEMRKKQKAREWFLLGQLQAALGNDVEATKAFKHVIRLNPPYQLAFNANISMTEVMAGKQSKKMISKLQRMAASDNNKEYLDQVYYAIGNIYLAEKDTLNAISAYEKGNKKATRSGIEKGVLLLHLGDLYWQLEKFSDARRCYGEAIGLLDKDRKDYEQLSDRSRILDELVPFTDAVHLQDSLQALAKMNEKDRNAAIDRVITALKKKEKEEKNKDAEGYAQQQQSMQGGMQRNNRNTPAANRMNNQNGTWYFYNPMAVSQGKTSFQQLWGKRDNVDNWQRINKTVVANMSGAEEMTDAMRDSLAQVSAQEDSIKQVNDSAQNDPHKREYYLAQIPFTAEQMAESNAILEDGLYHSGVIFKDKLDHLTLSEKNLRRLVDNYPDYEHMDDAYYHLYLLYSRKKDTAMADSYLKKLQSDYPESQWTALLSDPYFKENAVFGKHIEDSLYAATYDAFKADRYDEVYTNIQLSENRFPLGENRDKFLFVGGMTKLNDGKVDACMADLNKLVKDYPQSQLSEMAGMIINGVNQGRKLHGAKFDLGDVWNRRSIVLNDSDTTSVAYSAERNTNYTFMLAYMPDSVNENQLLYELAKFNFTSFLVRNFDITIEDADGLHRMMVTGFRNFDEAYQYARQFYNQANIMRRIGKSRTYIISDQNLELLGSRLTYNDYEEFYNKNFAPLKPSTYYLLAEPVDVATEKQPEPTPEQVNKAIEKAADDNGLSISEDDGKTGSAGTDDGMMIIPEEEKKAVPTPDDGTIIIPEEKKATTTPDNGTIIIPEEEKKAATTPDNGTIIIPEEKPQEKPATQPRVLTPQQPATQPAKTAKPQPTTTKPGTTTTPAKPGTAKPATKPTTAPVGKPQDKKPATPVKPQTKPVQKKEDTGIIFSDGFGSNPQKKTTPQNKKKQDNKGFDLEDEYYDLEGF